MIPYTHPRSSRSPLGSSLARRYAGREMSPQKPLLALSSLLACSTPNAPHDLERRFLPLLEPEERERVEARAPGTAQREVLMTTEKWKRWSFLPEADRNAAARGDVRLGMQELAVLVAWGKPARRTPDERLDGTVEVLTYIRCASGLKRGRFVHTHAQCDGRSDTRELALRDGLVVDLSLTR